MDTDNWIETELLKCQIGQVDKRERNIAIWKRRHIEGATFKTIGGEFHLGEDRVRLIFYKVDAAYQRVRSRHMPRWINLHT